ncbi:MAG: hypothetical protein ABSF13_03285 [Smithella sp.]|jgi:hypothetical protein
MQTLQKRKTERHENLCEELLREKAAVLSRAGMAVEDVIERMMRMDREIEVKISILNSLDFNDHASELLQKKQLICEEINFSIEKFNALHQKAELQYYYLIVTREALGLRRHEMIREIYRIPEKKEKIQVI